jgi:hypothetical protein
MKRKSFYFFLLTSSFFVPTITFPGWTKDCPEIPKDITEITVKSNVATLRTEADKASEKGFTILADDKLKVLDHKSTVDKTGQELFCWYQVSSVRDIDNKPYFIADVGIKEFPFSNLSMGDKADTSTAENTGMYATSGQHSSPQIPANDKGTSGENSDAQKALYQNDSQQKWLPFILIGIGGIGSGTLINTIILVLIFSEASKVRQLKASVAEELKRLENSQNSIQRKLQRIQYDLGLPKQNGIPSTHEKLTTQERLFQEIEQNSNKIFEVLQRVENPSQPNQDKLKFITKKVEIIEDNQQNTSSLSNQKILLNPSDKRDEMIEQFNSQNRDYFRDDRFQPLTLTQRSIDGQVPVKLTQQSIKEQVVLNGCRILQLEVPFDSSQASYLTTKIDKENWLIPNIISPYIGKIMSNLDENPEIFTVESGSGSLRLIKPAKLKSVSLGLWEIEEPGEFQA